MDPSSRIYNPAPSDEGMICSICTDVFDYQPLDEEEKVRRLACNHIFHRECIGAWLNRSPSCPMCRAAVDVEAPEVIISEATQSSDVTPSPVGSSEVTQSVAQVLPEVRAEIQEVRRIRRINLNHNTPESLKARAVSNVASSFFGSFRR